MRVVNKRWLRALLLSCAYLLGAFGILASGSGGGSDGGGGVRVGSIELDQSASPTLNPTLLLTGNLVMIKPRLAKDGDEY